MRHLPIRRLAFPATHRPLFCWSTSGSLRQRVVHLSTALSQSKRPLDAPKDVLLVLLRCFHRVLPILEVWIVAPEVFAMSEARVKNAALTGFPIPCDREISGGLRLIRMM